MLKIGMLVFPKGLIAPEVYRVADAQGAHVELKPISLGGTQQHFPARDLRRYRLRTMDEVSWGESMVQVMRIVNPTSDDYYSYEIEDEQGESQIIEENELELHEGSLSPDPASQLAQLDLSPWELTSARMELLDAYFSATSRSLGILGYHGARMLPIPHQINAARYAVQFGRVRFLLADEVGLGKTVEAGLIVATLRKYFPDWQTAVFVPESLTAQWAFELYGKFGKLIYALNEEDFTEEEDGVILPHERIASFGEKHRPQILVVDEAHRVLRDPEAVAALITLSRRAHAVLLLTATPVADDVANLLKLLQILDPMKFEHIKDAAQLRDLQSRQGRVEAVLQAIRHGAPNPRAIEDAWKKTGIKDAEIERHLAAAEADDLGRHDLHRMATLITDRYYPGSRILRYRRKFLSQDNALPFRVVDSLVYTATAEEKALIAAAEAWFTALSEAGLAADTDAQALAASLYQAAFSSPLAVAAWIAMRRGELDFEERATADPVILVRHASERVDPLDGEDELLEQLDKANTKWTRGVRAIDANARHLARSPRYLALLKFLKEAFEEEPDGHILIFTAFEANVHPLWLLLRKALTDIAEVYEMCGTQPRTEREKNAFEFQEFPSGSVLISDELGGEGRNFQFASHVIHYDLPPTPWTVEQRIGRCDRVGRDEEMDVDSQVILAEGLLDEAVYTFLCDGVGVFNDSIAPIEGELDEVVRQMMERLINEGDEGVTELIDEVSERLEAARERENADLLVRSAVGVQEARRVSSELNDTEELLRLRKAAIHYVRLFESMVDEQDGERLAITVGEFHSLHAAAGVLPEMIGYFNRKLAVRHERLDFFSPGHPLIKGMASMSMVDSPDRASIIRRKGIRNPVILFIFRISLPSEYFQYVRTLNVDLRPPLLSRSAALFGTRMQRLAVTLEGEILPPTPANGASYTLSAEGDEDLSNSQSIATLLPKDWLKRCESISAEAQSQADDIAATIFEDRRGEYEDLVCEVLARVLPSADPEKELDEIMEKLGGLAAELDSVVLLLPAR